MLLSGGSVMRQPEGFTLIDHHLGGDTGTPNQPYPGISKGPVMSINFGTTAWSQITIIDVRKGVDP
jgi:hypothetical protein